jgi:hypothetical protein
MPDGDMLPTSGDETYASQLVDFLAADDGFGGAKWWMKELNGFGDVNVKSQDMPYALAHGSKATVDLLTDMMIVQTLQCDMGTAVAAEEAWCDLRTAYLPTSADVDLHLWLPWWGHVKLTGRPREAKLVSRLYMAKGKLRATASFLATNPEIVSL